MNMNHFIYDCMVVFLFITFITVPSSCSEEKLVRHSMVTNIAIILDKAANGPMPEKAEKK